MLKTAKNTFFVRATCLVKFHIQACLSKDLMLEERTKSALSNDFCGSNRRKTVKKVFQNEVAILT